VADAEAIDNAIMIRGDEAFIFYAFIWMAGTYTPYTALDDYLSFTTESGITDWGGATDLGTTMDEAGYAWHLVAFDYEGYKEGPVRGVITVGVSDLGGSTAMTLWRRETSAGHWAQFVMVVLARACASRQLVTSSAHQGRRASRPRRR
jgi:hypothetical protein